MSTYMRTLVPGFTFATKAGPGDYLEHTGSLYPAELVADSVIDDIKAGVTRIVQDEDERRVPAELVEIDDEEARPQLRPDLQTYAGGRDPLVQRNIDQKLQEPADPDLGGDGAPGIEDPNDPSKGAGSHLTGDEYSPVGKNVSDVLEYLKTASPEEVDRVKAVEADGDRNSKQVADFEAKGD